jgi:1-phosphofructokinase
MIYTLTLNPAIDYVMSLPERELISGDVNRSDSQRFSLAGKGVNVSLALKSMGVDNTAICLCGQGFVGEKFARMIEAHAVESVLIPVLGCDTRINVKLCHDEAVTEVNGSFSVDDEAVDAVKFKLSELVEGDILIIGGSRPKGFPVDIYAQIASELTDKGVLVVADTSGNSLRALVKTSVPFLVKPNRQELGELFCVEIESIEDAIAYGRKIGSTNTIVTMGEQGAVMITADEFYVCPAPRITMGYTVGAGDALLAGFVAEYIKSRDYERSLIAGVDNATDYIESHIPECERVT